MKTCFIQDWGTFRNDTFVVVGMTRDEILRAMKRRHFRKDAIQEFEYILRPKPNDEADAFIWTFGGLSLLWFKDWAVDLEHYGCLVHETNHLVFEIGRNVGFGEESEANAYTQQYLWLNIIRKLNKALGVKFKRSKRANAKSKNPRREDDRMSGLQSRIQKEGRTRKTSVTGQGDTGSLATSSNLRGTWRRRGQERSRPATSKVRSLHSAN